jgi:hypothetical protein
LFENAVLDMKEISANTLRELAATAGVSLEVVVRRLGPRSDLLRQRCFFGCVALLRQGSQGLSVRAVSVPKHLDISSELQLIHPGEKWQLTNADGERIDPTDAAPVSEVSLVSGTGGQRMAKTHRMEVALVNRSQSEATYLLVLQEGHAE